MADLNLSIGVPSGDHTLSATAGNVRRVKIPQGTAHITITTASDFYVEEDPTQAKLDEAASDTTKRHKYLAGSLTIPAPGRAGAKELTHDWYIYVVGTVASQPIWITPRLESL